MGAALGPVLANIIMTEMERIVVDKLIESGRIKFYIRYVDDTLLLVKPEDVNEILQQFNNYHRNLEFTVDRFDDCIPHFLDLELHPDGVLSIYRKDTHTAQFVHHDSFTRWNHKVAWIRSLASRAKRLCSPTKLKDEIKNITRFASYNGFPRWTVKKILRESMNRQERRVNDRDESEKIYMFLPYCGKEAESVVFRCKKRLSKLFKKISMSSFKYISKQRSCLSSHRTKIRRRFLAVRALCISFLVLGVRNPTSVKRNRRSSTGQKNMDGRTNKVLSTNISNTVLLGKKS